MLSEQRMIFSIEFVVDRGYWAELIGFVWKYLLMKVWIWSLWNIIYSSCKRTSWRQQPGLLDVILRHWWELQNQNNKQTTSTKLTHQTKRSKAARASGSAGNRMVAPPSLVRPNSSLIMQTLDDPHGGRGPRTTSYERRSKIKDKQRTRKTVNLERTMERQNDRTTGFCDVPETLGCSSDTFSPTQPHNTCYAVHAHPLVF